MSKTLAEQIAEILDAKAEYIKKIDPCVLVTLRHCKPGMSCPKCRKEFWNKEAKDERV